MPPKMGERARAAFLGCRLGEAILLLQACETDSLRLESMKAAVADTRKDIAGLRARADGAKIEKYDRLQTEKDSWTVCEELLNFPIYGQETKARRAVTDQLLSSDFFGADETDARLAEKIQAQKQVYDGMDTARLLQAVRDKKDQAGLRLDNLCRSDPILDEISRDAATCQVLQERSCQIEMACQDARLEVESREAAFRDQVARMDPHANLEEAVEALRRSVEGMTPARLREQSLHIFKSLSSRTASPEEEEGPLPEMAAIGVRAEKPGPEREPHPQRTI